MLAVSLRSGPEPAAARRGNAAGPAFATDNVDVEPDHLHIIVQPTTSASRGALRRFIDECIEFELDTQGAPPTEELTGCGATRLRDQQYRARLLGYRGITLELANLDAIACNGVLDVEDSGTLEWWLEGTADPALDVHLSETVQHLAAYPRPVPLRQWLAERRSSALLTVPAPEPDSEPAEFEEQSGFTTATEWHDEPAAAVPLATPSELPGAPVLDEITDSEAQGLQLSSEADASNEVAEPAHAVAWREALESAEGQQSWDTLERLYIGSYLPLAHLASDGRASAASQARLSTWASDFQRCYQSAFARLRSGAPRPAMVLDVPQLAFALLREVQATQIRLVLVDGLRFDLGQRVHDKLRLQLLGHANCVQRRVLWAALPATTAGQLELLARGPCALGKTLGDLDERAWLARGSEARKLRALRVGPHQLRKLDILEAEFSRGPWDQPQLERAASEVAVATGRYVRQQTAGTLVVLFGDHGLTTPQGSQDATPEQVLVPFDAWLVHESANN